MGMVDAVHAMVRALLTEGMDLEISEMGNDTILVPFEDAYVHLRVVPRGGESVETVVYVWAPVLVEVSFSADLFEWVALSTDDFIFGHLALIRIPDGDTGNLVIAHRLVGSTLGVADLANVVAALAHSAAEQAKELQPLFGGRAVP